MFVLIKISNENLSYFLEINSSGVIISVMRYVFIERQEPFSFGPSLITVIIRSYI